MSNRFSHISKILLLALFIYLLGVPAMANAFPVPELPEDNLIVNPWFRAANDPTTEGLDGWTSSVLPDGVTWTLSQKISNPAPDIIVSARCGREPVYCGTSARWAKIASGPHKDETFSHVDIYLYQVVATDAAHRRLKFFTHWVSHRVAAADVSIYGGPTPDGPWTLVWVPFFHSQDELIVPPSRDVTDIWEQTGFLETTLEEGHSHYKVQIRARLPEGDHVGFKITGVYFATEFTEEPAALTPTTAPPETPADLEQPTSLPVDSEDDTPLPPDEGEAGSLEGTPPIETREAAVEAPAAGERSRDVTTLTALAVSPTQIQLSWAESENNSRGFIVERSLKGTGDWVRIARIGAQETAYADPQVNPGTLHYYRLRISSDTTSNVVAARTPPLSPTPSAFASATTVSQVAAEPDQAIDPADTTEVATPVPAGRDSSVKRTQPLLLLVIVPLALVVVLFLWRIRRPDQTQS